MKRVVLRRACEWIAALLVSVCVFPATPSAEIAKGNVRIGVLTDLSGFASDAAGEGSIVAVRMAVEDFGGAVAGMPIEIVSADHQDKAEIGAEIAREWLDNQGVDVVIDVAVSPVALAVNDVVRERNKVMLATAPATEELTGSACSPNTVHWTLDAWAVATATTRGLLKLGDDSWFFITGDHRVGLALERDASAAIEKSGGTVVGIVRTPFDYPDFAPAVLSAQGSHAKAIGLAVTGANILNAIRQAAEDGVVAGGQALAGLATEITDVHAIGLKTAQGIYLAEPFYWGLTDATRDWSQRFATLHDSRMPTALQAGAYAATLHYLKAVAASKSGDGRRVVETMKAMATNDPLFGSGSIRADGRALHPMYLFQVKRPEESKGAWDYYKLVETIPAQEAFRPIEEGGCPLVRGK
jgi:branched-chain amino acid transport system substrate-binding protein